MFRKIFFTLLLTSCLLFGNTTQEQTSSKPLVNDLLILPFDGGKLIKSGEIDVDAIQMEKMMQEVKPIMHDKYSLLLQKIFKLEKDIQRSIIKKATKYDDDLQQQVVELSKMKLEAAAYKIEALLKLKAILTPEQWQQWVKAK